MSFFQFTDLYVSGGDEPFNSAFKQDLAVGGTDRAAADKRDGAVDVSSSLVSGKAKNLRTANTLSGRPKIRQVSTCRIFYPLRKQWYIITL